MVTKIEFVFSDKYVLGVSLPVVQEDFLSVGAQRKNKHDYDVYLK